MKQLAPKKRLAIKELFQMGIRQAGIAKHFKTTQQAVSYTIQRFRTTNSVADRPRSGRPWAASKRDDHVIVIQCLKDRQVTSNSIKTSLNLPCSSRTVLRRLFGSGLVARKPKRKPLLNKKMRKNRLEWAKRRQSSTVDQWKQVIFSDESRFNVGRSDSVQFVRRRPGDAYKKQCLVPT